MIPILRFIIWTFLMYQDQNKNSFTCPNVGVAPLVSSITDLFSSRLLFSIIL